MGLCGNDAPDCTSWAKGGTAPNYKADPDIAGLGIILTFLFTSILALSLHWGSLIFMLTPDLNENPIDIAVARILRRFSVLKLRDERKKFWQTVVERLVLNLSDQQLLTGIAILVSGLIKLCSISVNHFTVISDLAWFSSSTHLTSLNLLEDYLRERPQLRHWRVGLMLIMFVLYLFYTVMEGHWAWYDSGGYQAQCLLNDLTGNIGGSPAALMSANILLVVISYGGAILSLYQGPANSFFIRAYVRLLDSIGAGIVLLKKKRTQSYDDNSFTLVTRAWYLTLIFALMAAKAVFVLVTASLGSQFFDCILELFWVCYGIWGLAVDRKNARSNMVGNENDMTFGQLVPIFLLSSTIFTFKEAHDDAARAQELDMATRGSSAILAVSTPDVAFADSHSSHLIEMSGTIANDHGFEPKGEPSYLGHGDPLTNNKHGSARKILPISCTDLAVADSLPRLDY